MAQNSYGWVSPSVDSTGRPVAASRMPAQVGQPMMAATGDSQFALMGDPYAPVPPGPTPQMGGPVGLQNLITGFMNSPYSNLAQYANKENRDQFSSYAENYAVPLGNLGLGLRTQMANEEQARLNFGEQQRLNTTQMLLAQRGSQREDEAMKFAQGTNQRDFTEARRQFDATNRMEESWRTGQLDNQMFGLQTERMAAEQQVQLQQRQAQIADFEARTGRMDVEGRQEIERMSQDTNRMLALSQIATDQAQRGVPQFNADTERMLGQAQIRLGNREADITRELGLGQQRLEGRGQDITRELGLGQQNIDRTQIANQYDIAQRQLALDTALGTGQLSRERYDSETARLAQQAQAQLGQGQLRLGNREADIQRELGLGGLNMQGRQLDLERQLGLGGLNIQQQEVNTARDLGFGNLGVSQQNANTGRYDAETTRLLGQGNLGVQSEANRIVAARDAMQRDLTLRQQALDAALGQGRLSIDEHRAQTERLNTDNQMRLGLLNNALQTELGRGQLSNEARSLNIQEELGRFNADTQRQTQMGQLDVNRYASETDRLAQLALQQFQNRQIDATMYQNVTGRLAQDAQARFQAGQIDATNFQNMTQRMQVQNEFALGQGGLQQQSRATDVTRELGLAGVGQQRYATDIQAQQAERQRALDRTLGLGTLGIQQQQAGTGQYSAETQRLLGQQQNATNRYGINVQAQTAAQQNANQRYGTDVTRELGLGELGLQSQLGNRQAATGEYNARTQRLLGNQQNANQRYGTDVTRELGLGANATNQYSAETARTNVGNQFTLGQGQLGFQNRELDVTDSFRRDQLNTQSQLERERMAADTMNNRYQVFGRSRGPNTRMAQSFRSA